MVRIFDEDTEEVLLDVWGPVALADEAPAAPRNPGTAPRASKASPAAPKAAEASNVWRPAPPAAPPAAAPATPKAAPVAPKAAAAPQPVPPPPPTAPRAGAAAPCATWDAWDPALLQAPFVKSGPQVNAAPATPPVGNATGGTGTWRPTPAPSTPPGLGVPWRCQDPDEEPATRQEDARPSSIPWALADPMDLAYRNLQNRLNLGSFPRYQYENIFGPISAEHPWGSRFWAGALLALVVASCR